MRSTPFVVLALFTAACIDRPVSGVTPSGTHIETIQVPTSVERDVDILFVIDSSGSMTEEHAALRNDFGTLLDRLDDTGDLPNVHIGVVSSDLGTAPYDIAAGSCDASGGDDGRLLGSGCPALAGNTFLSDVLDPADGSRLRNYSGTLEDAFGCMSNVGSTGCGFEQHLEAMKRALTPDYNPGFVRPEAALAVIFIADEDDCSARDPGLYNPSDPNLGPLTDFRCHAFGIVCDDDPDPGAPGIKTGCRPDPDSPYLQTVQSYVDFLVELKGGNPEKVAVAGIIGDIDHVEVVLESGRPTVAASCPAGGLGASEPGIRFHDFFSRFTYHSTSTLCAADLNAALDEVGSVLDEFTGSMCLKTLVADRNPNLDGVQAECSVTQHLAGVETVLPSCDSGAVPCWRFVADAECTDTALRIEIDRGGALAPEDGTIDVQCVVES